MERIVIEKFDAKFEGILISVHSIKIQQWEEAIPEMFSPRTPHSGVWTDMYTDNTDVTKKLIGNVRLLLRNYAGDEKVCLHLIVDAILTDGYLSENADTFCKFIRYLFDWAEKYSNDHTLVDSQGNKFAIPRFLYAKGHFKNMFPD